MSVPPAQLSANQSNTEMKMQQAVHAVHNYMCASCFYGNAGKGTALCTELWDWLCLYSVCVPASMSGGITAQLDCCEAEDPDSNSSL